MKLTKNPVFLHYFSKFMGILLFVLKYMYISLLLKMIYGFSWPAKIMASPNPSIKGGLPLTKNFLVLCSYLSLFKNYQHLYWKISYGKFCNELKNSITIWVGQVVLACSWVIDQNNILTVLTHNLKTSWLIKISMYFLSSLDDFLSDV